MHSIKMCDFKNDLVINLVNFTRKRYKLDFRKYYLPLGS